VADVQRLADAPPLFVTSAIGTFCSAGTD
jgi:hypothetical protein